MKKKWLLLMVLAVLFFGIILGNGVLAEDKYPASPHPYSDYCDQTWIHCVEGADALSVTFSGETFVENRHDSIIVMDGANNVIGEYTGDALAGQTVVVSGSTVKIRLKSDSSFTYWGFEVTEIKPIYDKPVDDNPVDAPIASANQITGNNMYSDLTGSATLLGITPNNNTLVKSNVSHMKKAQHEEAIGDKPISEPLASTFSTGSLVLIIGISAIVIIGVAAFVILKKRK